MTAEERKSKMHFFKCSAEVLQGKSSNPGQLLTVTLFGKVFRYGKLILWSKRRWKRVFAHAERLPADQSYIEWRSHAPSDRAHGTYEIEKYGTSAESNQ